MARTRKVGLDLLSRRFVGYVTVLINLDPLTHDFLSMPDFDKVYSPDNPLHKDAVRSYREHHQRLWIKWGCPVVPVPPPIEEIPADLRGECLKILTDRKLSYQADPRLSGQADPFVMNVVLSLDREYTTFVFQKGVRPTWVVPASLVGPLAFRYTFNRGCVGLKLREDWALNNNDTLEGFWCHGYWCNELDQGRLVRGWDGEHREHCLGKSGLSSLNKAYALNIEVDLTTITHRNLEDAAAQVKKIIRAALHHVPDLPKREMDFLRTITLEAFTRAITAYDLHMREGLSFAQIAKRTKRSETRVEADVKRIYGAIHRADYTARRRRLDTPAVGAPTYVCPEHPLRDCPASCPYMRTWYERVKRSLPTDTTGTPRRIR